MTLPNWSNFERGTSLSASARAVWRSRFWLNSKRAHPPISPQRVRRQFGGTRELKARALREVRSIQSVAWFLPGHECRVGPREQLPTLGDFLPAVRFSQKAPQREVGRSGAGRGPRG